MVTDFVIYGPLAFVFAMAVGLGALWRVRSSRALHQQQKDAWQAYQTWRDSAPGSLISPPRGVHS